MDDFFIDIAIDIDNNLPLDNKISNLLKNNMKLIISIQKI